MKTILILADTDLLKDGRIRRYIIALKNKYKLIVTGIKNPNIEGNIEFIDCSKENITEDELNLRRKLLRERMARKLYEDAYWGEAYIEKLYNKLINKHVDIIIANDITMVPLGVILSEEKNIKILADMHEYAPKEFEDIAEWKELFQDYKYYLCKQYLPKCNNIITVSKGIANEYKKEFAIQCTILTNAPMYKNLNIKKTTQKIRMVYHGVANKSRKLHKLLKVINYLDDRFTLDFYLVGDRNSKDMSKMITNIKNTPRCYVHEPIKPEEIVSVLHRYDIGIFLLEPVNFNYKYALPNKFFEFVQARLAVAIGPSFEMQYYINKYNIGIVSENFESEVLAERLNKLTINDIDLYKSNTNELAEKENLEKNIKILNAIIDKLI